jgi:hypothetical protein
VHEPKSPIETLDAAEVATLLNAGKLLLIDGCRNRSLEGSGLPNDHTRISR